MDHRKECDVYEQRIAQLKEEQSHFQNIINDYKFELNALTAIDVREEQVEGLRNHIKDANQFLQEAEREMEKQTDIIEPVLAMVNIAAKNQKYKELGTQTECQINCNMAHLHTQVDARSLMSFANTSMGKLQACVQQLKALEEASGENADLPLSAARKKEKSRKSRSPSKKKSVISRRGGLSSEVSKMLDDLDSDPLPLEELMRSQGLAMTEYSKFVSAASFQQRSMHWTFGDFLCGKLVQDQDHVLKAAVELSKLVSSLCQPQYKAHPLIQLSKKLLGLDGFREPDVAACAYFCAQKESLDKEVQLGQANNVSFHFAVEFLKRTFKEVSSGQPLYHISAILFFRTINCSIR